MEVSMLWSELVCKNDKMLTVLMGQTSSKYLLTEELGIH